MSEPGHASAATPETRRRLLREAVGDWVPGWRPLAENLLGADARIDLVGCDARGAAVIALVDLEPDGDMALVAWGLAQRAWVEARLPDWAQLAPETGLSEGAGVRALLLAPRFRPAALEAAAAHPGLQPLVVHATGGTRGEPQLWIASPDGAGPPPAVRANGAAGFRSGLSAEDLDLTPDEIEELRAR